jgi:hypothetical protein
LSELEQTGNSLLNNYRRERDAIQGGDQAALDGIHQDIEDSLERYKDLTARLLQFASLNRAAHSIETLDRGELTPAQQACADFEL